MFIRSFPSTCLDQCEYTPVYPPFGEFKLWFDDGSIYVYHAVHEDVASGFLLAESKGAYFNSEIRGQYAYTKLN